MFRSTTVLYFKTCRSISFKNVKSSVNYKPHLLHKCNFSSGLPIAQSSTAGTASVSDPSVIPKVDTPIDQAPPSSITDAVVQAIQSIPEHVPVPDLTGLKEIIVALTSNGQSTLQSMGLGGWSPVGMTQEALVFLHCDLGLPWYLAITMESIIIRLILFPLVMKTPRVVGKMLCEIPKIQIIQKKINEYRKLVDAFMTPIRFIIDSVMFLLTEKGLKNPLKTISPPAVMSSMFISCLLGLRGMVHLPVESMKTGGVYWFTDLTVHDPYYILPAVTSLTLWWALEIRGSSLLSTTDPWRRRLLYSFRVALVIVLASIKDQPAALSCLLASSSTVYLIQVLAMKIPEVAAYFDTPKEKRWPHSRPRKEKMSPETVRRILEEVKDSKLVKEQKRFEEKVFKRAGRAPIPKTYRWDPTKIQAGVTEKGYFLGLKSK